MLAVFNFRKYYITEIKITIPKLSGNNRKLSFTKWDDLPENAQKYIRRLEELSGAKVAILSTGPEREQTIYLDDPFAD